MSKGVCTVNAVAVYDDNVLLADWLFDMNYNGSVSPARAGRRVPAVLDQKGNVTSPARFDGPPRGSPTKPYHRLFSLAETAAMTSAERRLPWMPTEAEFEQERHVGGLISRLWQGQEQQQLYLFDHEKRLVNLEQVTIDENGNVGIGTTTPASTLTITGNFSATGPKAAVVNTTYGIRKLYAMESPDIRFYDEGRARLSNGIANISLDPIFIETVEPEYNVHLTPEGKTLGIYVDEKAKEYFIVKSYVPSSNIAFTWQISAIRKGYRDVRLDLERKEGIEIIAVVDEINKVTDVNINGIENQSNENLNLITGNAVNELSEGKIKVNSDDKDEIIKEIEEKTKLDKDKIKKAITFRRKSLILKF